MKKNYSLILTILMSTLLTGCLSTPTSLKKNVTLPANEAGMRGAKRIYVITPENRNGAYRNLVSGIPYRFSSFFSEIRVNGVPHFQVVEREILDKVQKEQKISSGYTFDESTAVRLGRLTGADTIISGNYLISDVEKETYYDTERVCVREGEKRGGLLGSLGVRKCEEYRDMKVRCTRKNAKVEFTPKATSVEQGTVVYSKHYSSSANSERCDNEESKELLSNEQLVTQAFDSVFRQMRRDVAPYETVLEFDLMEDDDSAMPILVKGDVKLGIELARGGLFDRACERFRMGASRYDGSPAIFYNLGVCQEAFGDKYAALAYFERALSLASLLSSDDKDLLYSGIKRLD